MAGITQELAGSIARELGKLRGEDWTAQDGYWSGQFMLTGPDGMRIYLRAAAYGNASRLAVHGELPAAMHRVTGNPHITVATARGPAVIAKEINRRLIPGYAECLRAVSEYNDTERRQYAERGRVVDEIRAMFGQEAAERKPYEPGRGDYYRDSVRLDLPGRGYGVVEAYGEAETLSVELRSIPRGTVMRMLAVLAEPVKAE